MQKTTQIGIWHYHTIPQCVLVPALPPPPLRKWLWSLRSPFSEYQSKAYYGFLGAWLRSSDLNVWHSKSGIRTIRGDVDTCTPCTYDRAVKKTSSIIFLRNGKWSKIKTLEFYTFFSHPDPCGFCLFDSWELCFNGSKKQFKCIYVFFFLLRRVYVHLSLRHTLSCLGKNDASIYLLLFGLICVLECTSISHPTRELLQGFLNRNSKLKPFFFSKSSQNSKWRKEKNG